MDEVLQLLRQLFIVTTKKDNVHIEAFNSKRITNKLVQQIQVGLHFSQLIVYVFKIRRLFKFSKLAENYFNYNFKDHLKAT